MRRQRHNAALLALVIGVLGCSGNASAPQQNGALTGGTTASGGAPQSGLSSTLSMMTSTGGSSTPAGGTTTNTGGAPINAGGTATNTGGAAILASGGTSAIATGGTTVTLGGASGGMSVTLGGASGGTTVTVGGASGGTTAHAGGTSASGSGTGGQLTSGGIPVDPIFRDGYCAEKWCWSLPLPQGNAIRAMWSQADAGVWAVGDAGVTLHWNGSNWDRAAVLGSNGADPCIWGSGPSDIYLDVNGLWHFDGQRFSQVSLPSSFANIWFNDISGTGPKDVWAAISTGVAHFDGSSWSIVSGIAASTGMQRVRAAAPNAVWVTGQGLNYWDGQMWTKVSTNQLVDIFSTGADDIWYASGGSLYRGGISQGFARSGTYQATFSRGLFGTGPSDVFLAGYNGGLVHFDGQSWGSFSVFTDESIYGGYALTGTAYQPGEAWLGGTHGRLWRATNGQLQALTPQISTIATRDLKSVWSDGTSVYAVGGSVLKRDASASGDQWQPVAGTESLFGFTGIWGSSPTDIWISGTAARMWHFDGTTLATVSTGAATDTDWNDIHGSGPNDVWAVGTKGRTVHWDGQQWTLINTGITNSLDDVWVSPDGNTWAVGSNGAALHYTPGQDWSTIPGFNFSTAQWTAVTGTSNTDVWVASYHEDIFHFDGNSWKNVTGTGYASGYIQKLWALAPNNVWGAADYGSIVHWDGAKWTRLDVRAYPSLIGIWMNATGEGWVVGESGTILHRVP